MKTFNFNEIQLIEAEYKGKNYTFVKPKTNEKEVYLLITEIEEHGYLRKCLICKSTRTKAVLVGRKGITYKVKYCDECKKTTIVEFKTQIKKIPIKVLLLVDLAWEINTTQEGE